MKQVKQLNVPPTSLQRFLQDYPPTTRHISDWHAFRNDNGGKRYRELINELTHIQHGLCAYCEI